MGSVSLLLIIMNLLPSTSMCLPVRAKRLLTVFWKSAICVLSRVCSSGELSMVDMRRFISEGPVFMS